MSTPLPRLQFAGWICDGCGCTDDEACADPATGMPCSWVEHNWCSFCDAVDGALVRGRVDVAGDILAAWRRLDEALEGRELGGETGRAPAGQQAEEQQAERRGEERAEELAVRDAEGFAFHPEKGLWLQ
jgi:hypothetical protein